MLQQLGCYSSLTCGRANGAHLIAQPGVRLRYETKKLKESLIALAMTAKQAVKACTLVKWNHW
jgi:hypothetical protein